MQQQSAAFAEACARGCTGNWDDGVVVGLIVVLIARGLPRKREEGEEELLASSVSS